MIETGVAALLTCPATLILTIIPMSFLGANISINFSVKINVKA
jgi:hypothetical protein